MNRLERNYADHHEQTGRKNFTFGGQVRINKMVAWIGGQRHILDLGCRDGYLTSNFRNENVVIGADIDRGSLKTGRELGQLGDAVQLDLSLPLPFSPASFDCVVCGEILEHLPYPEWLINEVARLLVPGGLFIGSVPNAFRLKNRLRFLFGGPIDLDPTHLRFFSAKRLNTLLSSNFEEIEIRPMIGNFVFLGPNLFANDLVWRCKNKSRGQK